jgi:hypothetical protein
MLRLAPRAPGRRFRKGFEDVERKPLDEIAADAQKAKTIARLS